MKKLFLILVLGLLLCGNTQAAPTLFTNEVLYFDFINYENIYRYDDSGAFTILQPGAELLAGDVFGGVFRISNISNLGQSNDVDFLGGEVTGYFKSFVESVAITNNGADRVITFADTDDQFFRVYFDPRVVDANLNWNPGAVSAPKDLESLAAATGAKDGFLWFASEGSEGFISQYTNIVGAGDPNAAITGFSWYDFNVNNTNALFSQQLWPFFSGENWPGIVSQMSDAFFQFNISVQSPTNAIGANWTFNSVDPGYAFAVIPEPGTIFLLGIGLLGIAGLGRRKAK